MTGKTIHEKRYAFGEAAAATGISPKVIRNWFDREKITLTDEEREGLRWRRFSMFDILKLVLIKRLNDFGLPVRAAELYAMAAFENRLIYEYRNTPPKALAVALRGIFILAWRDRGGWDVRYLRCSDGALPADIPDAVIRIDVGRVADEVVQRLAEIDEVLGEGDD